MSLSLSLSAGTHAAGAGAGAGAGGAHTHTQPQPHTQRSGVPLGHIVGTGGSKINQKLRGQEGSTPAGKQRFDMLRLGWEKKFLSEADMAGLQPHGDAVDDALGAATRSRGPATRGAAASAAGQLEMTGQTASMSEVTSSRRRKASSEVSSYREIEELLLEEEEEENESDGGSGMSSSSSSDRKLALPDPRRQLGTEPHLDRRVAEALDITARYVGISQAPTEDHMKWLFAALCRPSLPTALGQRVLEVLIAVHKAFPLSHAPWFVLKEAKRGPSADQDGGGGEDDDDGDGEGDLLHGGESSGEIVHMLDSPFVWKGIDVVASSVADAQTIKMAQNKSVARFLYVLKEDWLNSHLLIRFYAAVFADELAYLRSDDSPASIREHSLRAMIGQRDRKWRTAIMEGLFRRFKLYNNQTPPEGGMTVVIMELLNTIIGLYAFSFEEEPTDWSQMATDVATRLLEWGKQQETSASRCRFIRHLEPGSFKLQVLAQLYATETHMKGDPCLGRGLVNFVQTMFVEWCRTERKAPMSPNSHPHTVENWARLAVELAQNVHHNLAEELIRGGDGRNDVLQAAALARDAWHEFCDELAGRAVICLSFEDEETDAIRAQFDLSRVALFNFE